MNTVNVEGDFAVMKSRSTEVKPTLGVSLSICAFAISGCPDGVLIGVDSDRLTHVSTVEVAVQNNLASVVVKSERIFMGNGRQFVLHRSFKTVLYFDQFNFINRFHSHHRRLPSPFQKFPYTSDSSVLPRPLYLPDTPPDTVPS